MCVCVCERPCARQSNPHCRILYAKTRNGHRALWISLFGNVLIQFSPTPLLLALRVSVLRVSLRFYAFQSDMRQRINVFAHKMEFSIIFVCFVLYFFYFILFSMVKFSPHFSSFALPYIVAFSALFTGITPRRWKLFGIFQSIRRRKTTTE